MNEKFLKEAQELEKRWAKTGLLSGIEDSYKKQTVAVLLENQRLMNESPVDTSDVSQFKRIKIPLIRRLHPQLWPQSTMNPCGEIPIGVQEECVLPVPVSRRKRKKVFRSVDDDWMGG